jgi:exopolysaccharide biosynthesis polyprenyl glycosylphosphotransferase
MMRRHLHGLIAAIDSLVGLGITLLILVVGNSERLPAGGAKQFLAVRVTLLNVIFAILYMITWKTCLKVFGLYRGTFRSLSRQLLQVAKSCFVMTVVLATFLLASHAKGPIFRILPMLFAAAFVYENLRIWFGGALLSWLSARNPQVVIILGSGPRAVKAWREIRTQYHKVIEVLGFVDDCPTEEMPPDIAARFLGTVNDLSEILLRNAVDQILIAVPLESRHSAIQRTLRLAQEIGVSVAYLNDMPAPPQQSWIKCDTGFFHDMVPQHEDYVLHQAVKRAFDIAGSLFGLLVLSPVFLLIALGIKLTSAGPVFFVQQRYGYKRRIFPMFKFRSMVRNAPELMKEIEHQNEAKGPIFKIKNDPRITPFGSFLRKSSLDELPQLINVLVGDMSLVGPRPMSVRDVLLFDKAALMRRFSVKPGVTGLWQVAGRHIPNFDQWVALDCSYIDSWSLALDFEILARTLPAVMKRSGAA